MGVSSLPKTVTRQRRDCDFNLGFLCLSPPSVVVNCMFGICCKAALCAQSAEMWPIGYYRCCVYVCVCLFVAHNRETMICAKMAEPIEVPFGMLTVVGLRNIVLGGALDPTRK